MERGGIVGAALLLQGCLWEDEGVKLCKADLAKILKAPSTLQVVSAYRGEMPPIDHRARIAHMERLNEQDEARFDELSEVDRYYPAYRKNVYIPEMKAKRDPKTTPSYSILLTYDAENSFGAPLRGHYRCWMSDNPEQDGVFESHPIDPKEAESDKALMKEIDL